MFLLSCVTDGRPIIRKRSSVTGGQEQPLILSPLSPFLLLAACSRTEIRRSQQSVWLVAFAQGSKQYSSITKKTLVLHERKHMATPPGLDQESRPQRHPEQFHTPSPSALSLLSI